MKFKVGDIVTADPLADEGLFLPPSTPLKVICVYPPSETRFPYDCLDEATGDIYMMSDARLSD